MQIRRRENKKISLSVYQQFQKTTQQYRNKPFVIIEEVTIILSYAQISQLIDKFASYLTYELKLKKQDRVALLLNNQLEFVVAFLAINKLGMICVPLNNRLMAEDLEFMIKASSSKAIVFYSIFQEKIDGISEVLKIDAKIIKELKTDKETPVINEENAFILFTSGTTGLPKGVLHTNENILFYAQIMIDGFGFDSLMKQLIAAPLYHAIGSIDQLIPAIILGETVVLTNNPAPQNVAMLLEKHNIEVLQGPPTIFALLILSGAYKKHKLLSSKIFGYAGAPMRSATIKMLKKAFPHIKLFNYYGSTEVGGTITILDDKYASSHSETVGQAVKGVKVKILADDKFVTNEVGEVITRSRYMKDYVNADAKKSFYNGYLRMGDLGKIDEHGFLTLFGRMGDMMIIQGENVYPIEIERVLLESGLLKEVCAVGKNTVLGHEPVVFICPHDENEKEVVEKLRDLCQEKLADFKRPRDFIVLKELPKNATGKIDKKKIKELL